MRPTKRLYFALLLCGFPVVGLACLQPPLPIVPQKQDIRGQERTILVQMQRFTASMAGYVNCVRAELDTVGNEGSSALQRKLLVLRYNHAVEEIDAMANVFAERVGPLESLRAGVVLNSEPSSCVAMTQADKIRVVDNHRVLFYHAGHVFLNSLATDCVGLEHSGSFMHRGIGGRVTRYCSKDLIVVADSNASSCKLGDFYEITGAQVDLIKNGTDVRD